MTPDDLRHGKYSGAIQHWKDSEELCTPCRLAATRKRKQTKLAELAGQPRMVNLGELAWNIIHHHPRNQLVAATGMSHPRLHRYDLAGPTKRVHRTTRDRIIAATPHTWTPIGIQRRLQALSALGWSMQALSTRYDLGRDALGRMRRRHVQHVRLSFGTAIAELYDELSMQPPPAGMSAATTRSEAINRGYLPPLAWDDIDHDAHPARTKVDQIGPRSFDHAVVERILAGDRLEYSVAERRAVVERLWTRGLGPVAIAARCGFDKDTVGKDIERLGLKRGAA